MVKDGMRRGRPWVLVAVILVSALAIARILIVRGGSSPSASPSPGALSAGVWKPAVGTTWQWQIVGTIGRMEKVQMYDVDLQDAVPADTTYTVPGFGTVTWPKGANAGIIDRLHSAGIIAICYMDDGAWESYRPDAKLFPGSVIGNGSGWNGERYLDIRRASWPKFEALIWARYDLAKSIGCDGIEGDQKNSMNNNPGFAITRSDERAWYLKTAEQGHARGMSMGMKNGGEVIDSRTVAAYDWALNEECVFYSECNVTAPFIAAGKAVFNTEYTIDWKKRDPAFKDPTALKPAVCRSADRPTSFSTVVENLVPDGVFVHCWR